VGKYNFLRGKTSNWEEVIIQVNGGMGKAVNNCIAFWGKSADKQFLPAFFGGSLA
jgi:hypothetical protein